MTWHEVYRGVATCSTVRLTLAALNGSGRFPGLLRFPVLLCCCSCSCCPSFAASSFCSRPSRSAWRSCIRLVSPAFVHSFCFRSDGLVMRPAGLSSSTDPPDCGAPSLFSPATTASFLKSLAYCRLSWAFSKSFRLFAEGRGNRLSQTEVSPSVAHHLSLRIVKSIIGRGSLVEALTNDRISSGSHVITRTSIVARVANVDLFHAILKRLLNCMRFSNSIRHLPCILAFEIAASALLFVLTAVQGVVKGRAKSLWFTRLHFVFSPCFFFLNALARPSLPAANLSSVRARGSSFPTMVSTRVSSCDQQSGRSSTVSAAELGAPGKQDGTYPNCRATGGQRDSSSDGALSALCWCTAAGWATQW